MQRLLRLGMLLSAWAGIAPARLEADSDASAERPPNIVLIISDDHGWTDYSFMGHAHLRTPHLDRLARESCTFRRGYVPSSLCCPSLASILTGLYPHQHRITSNDPPLPADEPVHDPRSDKAFHEGRKVMNRHLEAVPTLPRLLAARGYLSLQTGKWWHGEYRRGGFTHGMTRGERHGDDGLKIGRATLQPIYDFIADARKKEKPFFVWYAPMMPHSPHTPPERLLAKYQTKTASPHVARYWAMVEWFDETCGTLLAHLDRQGLADNTIVVYVTDNGWIQNPEQPRSAPKSKQSPYDGGLRTPIMVRWPGRVKPRMSDDLALSIDLAPTLLAAAGLKPPAELQGVNLLDEGAAAMRKAIFGECFTHNAVDLNAPARNLRWRWIVEGDWKLIAPDAQNEPAAHAELYNLDKDPHETKDLSAEQPDKVQQLRRKLDAWWNPRLASDNLPATHWRTQSKTSGSQKHDGTALRTASIHLSRNSRSREEID